MDAVDEDEEDNEENDVQPLNLTTTKKEGEVKGTQSVAWLIITWVIFHPIS